MKEFTQIEFKNLGIYKYESKESLREELVELEKDMLNNNTSLSLTYFKNGTSGDYTLAIVSEPDNHSNEISLNERYIVMSKSISPKDAYDFYNRKGGVTYSFDEETINFFREKVNFYTGHQHSITMLSVDFGGNIKNFIVYN